jgi:hypothetical protein
VQGIRKSVRLVFADSQKLDGTTDASGHVVFDISAIRATDEAFKSGSALLVVANNEPGLETDVTNFPQYGRWMERARVSKAASDAAAHAAELDAGFTKALDQCRTFTRIKDCFDLEALMGRPEFAGRNVEAQAVLIFVFPRIVDLVEKNLSAACETNDCEIAGQGVIETITTSSIKLSDAPARVARVKRMIARGKVAGAANAVAAQKAQQNAIYVGRQVVLANIKTPSTARFVSDQMLYPCKDGEMFLTSHELDAQNGFGAMIRDSVCTAVVPRTGRGTTTACGPLITFVLHNREMVEEICQNSRMILRVLDKLTQP